VMLQKHKILDNYEFIGFLPQRVSPIHSLFDPSHELSSSISVRLNQSIKTAVNSSSIKAN
jgi:hypothetical protein